MSGQHIGSVPSSLITELWRGSIPVCFSLAADEVDSSLLTNPQPHYVMGSRLTYLPILSQGACESFERLISNNSQHPLKPWFEFDGKPLQWHFPLGLLYDLYHQDHSLPFQITIHFKNYPDSILAFENQNTVSTNYFHSLKQALYVKYNSIQPLNSLMKSEQVSLWNALVAANLSEFWRSNYSIAMNAKENSLTLTSLPLRIMFSNQQNKYTCIQKLLAFQNEDKKMMTFSECLSKSLPSDTIECLDKYLITCHGIDMTSYNEIPMIELMDELCFPDQWLYLVIRPV